MSSVLDDLIQAELQPKGQGGEVTATAVATAIGQMTSSQKSQAREDLGGEPEKFVVTITISGSNYSADKTIAEIYAAYTAGKTLDVVCGGAHFIAGYIADDEMYFTKAYADDTGSSISRLYVDDSDSWSYEIFGQQRAIIPERVAGATPTITPIANTIYNCTASALTSLTITDPPATGSYSIIFTSGSTATTTTIPSTILGLESFAAEANTMYEINVLDNRAVVGSWAVSVS